MRSLWRIFSLELLSLARGGTLALLTVVSLGWVVVVPSCLVTDGTAEGARTIYLQYALGGVFAFLMVALMASAAGAIATEREAKRLQLTQVRPVSGFVIAFGKYLAHLLVGAVILLASAALILAKEDPRRPCNHVFRPVMESPRAEAEKEYEAYLKDPETPDEVKKAKREAVIRLLEQRSRDRHIAIATNAVARWTFPAVASDRLSARFHFSGQFNMRETVCGEAIFGTAKGRVEGQSQTAMTVPLVGTGSGEELCFENRGMTTLMLRPRQDVELLMRADGFWQNLLRAVSELVALLAVTIAFGLFLGAGLSRPVALFTGLIVLLVSEMGPSVVEQYPDQLEADRLDRIGLDITRAAESVTRPLSQLSPISQLVADDCVESREVLTAAASHLLAWPLLLSLLSGFLLARKTE